jgi:LPXTG-motif cell wall-anchored protein
MRSAWIILGALLILSGTVFFFQGIGVLPGSFMSGQVQWAVYGGLAVIGGGVLLYLNRKKSRKEKD